MVVRIFTGLGRPVRILSVPPGLFAAVTRLGRMIPGLGGVRPEMVRRQALDLVFDDARARAVLAYRPRPFEPGPAEFELPGAERLRRLAGLADA
jgi:hypothetical protein